MDFLVTKTLNSILYMDSFEHTQPLNLEPNTIGEINLKSSSPYFSQNTNKGNIFL